MRKIVKCWQLGIDYWLYLARMLVCRGCCLGWGCWAEATAVCWKRPTSRTFWEWLWCITVGSHSSRRCRKWDEGCSEAEKAASPVLSVRGSRRCWHCVACKVSHNKLSNFLFHLLYGFISFFCINFYVSLLEKLWKINQWYWRLLKKN